MNVIPVSRKNFYGCIAGLVFLSVVFLVMLIVESQSKESIFLEFLIIYPVIILGYVYMIYNMKVAVKLKAVHVFDDRIEIIYKKSNETIFFKDIQKLKVTNKLAGWYTIITESQQFKVRHTVLQAKEIGFLIEAIYKQRPDLLVAKDFSKLRLSQFRLSIGHAIINKFLLSSAALALLFFYLVFVKQFHQYDLGSFSDFLFISEICIAVPFILSTLVFGFVSNQKYKQLMPKINNSSFELKPNVEFQNSVLRPAFSIVSVVFGLYFFAVVKYDLNFISHTVVGENIQHMNIKADETAWVDQRFGLLPGFEISKDMRVTYEAASGLHLGVIVGVPEDKVVINIDYKGRKLASEENVIVPADQYAIRGGVNGERIRLVPKTFVEGKILNKLSDFF